ncbi:Mannosyl-oligosaccharide 1,2-alpha-mannosidase MNS3 [Hibiscus syriacus]|uniref:alpha-1,2-Mannosidase n=1 Tax=Hibiscus syriacus TaxID=106335 RepID=A0A6A3ACX7_HIBSY|nr:Mannosyl-oligosaccharide 1,2-alpha-mannosidase MNS3 [Hibiscus syriacus]
MSKSLPYSMKDVHYDNAKFRHRSFFKVVTQTLFSAKGIGTNEELKEVTDVGIRDVEEKWIARQQNVKDAFTHAWSGYKKFAMGYDELMPVSQHGVDELGGIGATVVDALDTAMIMGLDEVVSEAGSWIESHLLDRINNKGQVNLFETTIRVLGGLLSAFHLSGGDQGIALTQKGPKPAIYLNIAKNLADRLLSAFTSSPTPIPFSDVVLRDSSAHPAPDGLSSTSEVSTYSLNSIISVQFLVIQSMAQKG